MPEQGAITYAATPLADPSLHVPKIMFFTKGKGLHKDYPTSFELALRDAQIADLNLLSVSSIKPPGCRIVSIQDGRKHLMPRQVVFAIMARSAINEPNRLIAASIGLARPLPTIQASMATCRSITVQGRPRRRQRLRRRYGHGDARDDAQSA